MNPFVMIAFVGLILTLAPFMVLSQRPIGSLPRKVICLVPLAWAVELGWEVIAAMWGWNIRVDLLLIWPLMLVLSLTAIAVWLFAKREPYEKPRFPVTEPEE